MTKSTRGVAGAPNYMRSISVGSSAGAFELLTWFDTGHREQVLGRGLEQLMAGAPIEPRLVVLLGEQYRHAVVHLREPGETW